MMPAERQHFFEIVVQDDVTGRGIPLVDIRLNNGLRDYTDSQGVLAFFEPALMNRDVFFQIRSHGYRFNTLVDGIPGVVLKPISGGNAVLTMTRINVAERLYRITGEGIYCHSRALGHSAPHDIPCLNAGVMGQDTALAALYQGKIFWFWGDTWGTDRVNFTVAGATSRTTGPEGPDPDTGVMLTYFVDTRGFAKSMCPGFGSGRVWLDWIAVVRDDQGLARLVARYTRLKSLEDIIECGFAVYNDSQAIFEPVAVLPPECNTSHLSNHPFRARVNNQDYVYFTAGYAFSRVRATLDAITDHRQYEYFGRLENADGTTRCTHSRNVPAPDRPIYGWKRQALPVVKQCGPVSASPGSPKKHREWIQIRDIETGIPVDACPGSIFWNRFRDRWIMIAQENMGQIWFAEAETPVGPWVYARKVVSHSDVSFYNPVHHPFFDKRNGRIIYFEGTYTHLFSGNADRVPRYDYNQIMYRLNLADPRVFLPQPVYRIHDTQNKVRYVCRNNLMQSLRERNGIDAIDFFAMQPNHTPPGTIPVFGYCDQGFFRLHPGLDNTSFSQMPALFHALPANLKTPDQQLAGNWQCRSIDSQGAQRPFMLNFQACGNILNADISPDLLTITKFSYSHQTIDLTLCHDQIEYRLHARFRQGRLTGIWHDTNRDQVGAWDGERMDFAWKQRNTLSVVPLFEYWNQTAGGYVYSTRRWLHDSGWVRSSSPLCLVWQNHLTDLALDFETEPV